MKTVERARQQAPLSNAAANASSFAAPARKKHFAAVGLLMLIFGITAFCYTKYFDFAKFPYSIEYEGHVLWACVNLSQGKNIYDPASLVQQPYAVIMYNPLFLAIGAALVKFFGVGFMPLRAISVIATLCMLPGFYMVLKRCRLSDFHAVTGVAFLASSLPVLYWSNVARVDMLGLALGVWGLERFLAGWRKLDDGKINAGSLVFSSALFILAFFTKQQYFVFPAAATIFCLLEGTPRLAAKHLTSWLLPILAIGALLQMVTGGGYLAHLGYASSLPWELDTLNMFLVPFLCDPKVIATAVILAAGFYAKGRRRPFERFAVILLAISLPLALYTMGLRAAFHNHLLCVYVALFWLVSVTLPRLSAKFTVIALVACLVGTYFAFGSCFVMISDRLLLCANNDAAMATLAKQNLQGKMILSEDPAIALALGATTDLVDSTTIFNVARARPDGLKPFVASIERRAYPVIILNGADVAIAHERIWPKPLIGAILKNYRLAGFMGGNGNPQWIYLEKGDKNIIR